MDCNCHKCHEHNCEGTCPSEYPGYDECEKIDALDVAAYFDLSLDPENPTGIIFESSWGEIKLDLKSIVKAGETITHLELAPEDNPTVIRYQNEAGDYECITGDELSRIISLHLLKDVDQTTPPSDGITYVYNGTTNLFEPYDIKTAITNLNTYLGRLEAEITSIKNRLTDIENLIYNYPQDKVTKIPRGDINLYSDYTNTNSKDHGFFTHDPNTDVANDEYFSQKGD